MTSILHTVLLISSFLLSVLKFELIDCLSSKETLESNVNHTYVVNIENKTISLCLPSGCKCYRNKSDDSSIQQITPFVIPQGASVNISANSSKVLQFFRATTESFRSCVISNETSPVFSITTLKSSLPQTVLETGTNLFICAYQNDSDFICENYCRINITVKVNECQNETSQYVCNRKGDCTSHFNETSFTCKCFDGFGGKTCEITYSDSFNHSVCEENNCLNGGTCVIKSSTKLSYNQSVSICECPPYVTGDFCETILNKCKSSPCVNGVCVEQAEGYQCYCVPGFHGKQCEHEYNECLSNPCLNKGTCVDRVDKYECRCPKGYTGVTCQEKVDMCRPNPCHRNSTCKFVGDVFHCVCSHSYTGTLCEQKIKSCDSNPCRNHGTCIEYEHGHQCMCPVTFAGLHCEYMMDVFAPPMEGGEMTSESHKHNLYIVAGTLGSMVLIVVSVIIACYCKIYETYKQLMWRRLRYHRKRSNSCPDLETYNEPNYIGKHRLSADAILEATSLCHENAAFENHQTFGNTSLQI